MPWFFPLATERGCNKEHIPDSLVLMEKIALVTHDKEKATARDVLWPFRFVDGGTFRVCLKQNLRTVQE